MERIETTILKNLIINEEKIAAKLVLWKIILKLRRFCFIKTKNNMHELAKTARELPMASPAWPYPSLKAKI